MIYLFIAPVLIILILFLRYKPEEFKKIAGRDYAKYLRIYKIKYFCSSFVFVLSIVFGLLAVSGIKIRRNAEPDKRKDFDIIITIDVSRSMLAKDIRPTRLKRSLQVAEMIIRNLTDNRTNRSLRFGVVVFRGGSTGIIPVTEDYSTVLSFLKNAGPYLITTRGTNIQSGINRAIDAFPFCEERNRLLLLFTDGESLSGKPTEAARAAAEKKVNIFSIAAATKEGSRIFLDDGTVVKNTAGEDVVSYLNEDSLKRISALTSGEFHSIEDEASISKLILSIDNILASGKSKLVVKHKEEYRIFLLAAVFLLILYILIRNIKWKNIF